MAEHDPGRAVVAIDLFSGLSGEILPCGCSATGRLGGIDRLAGVAAALGTCEPRIARVRVLWGDLLGPLATTDPMEADQRAHRAAAMIAALASVGPMSWFPRGADLAVHAQLPAQAAARVRVLDVQASRSPAADVSGDPIELRAVDLEAASGIAPVKETPGRTPAAPQGSNRPSVILLNARTSTPVVLSDYARSVPRSTVVIALVQDEALASIQRELYGYANFLLVTENQGRCLDTIYMTFRTDSAPQRVESAEPLALLGAAIQSSGHASADPRLGQLLVADVRRIPKTVITAAHSRTRIVPVHPVWPGSVDAITTYLDRVSDSPAPPGGQYRADGIRPDIAGPAACKGCHERQYAEWTADTFHSKAWESLVATRRANDFECFPCHVTGLMEGWSAARLRLEDLPLRKQVQCESCHGSGARHMVDPGTAMRNPGNVCVKCHDAEHSSEFSYDRYRARIGCVRVMVAEKGR